MKKWIFLALILPHFCSLAEFTIEGLNKITHSPDYLSGNFQQEKYLNDFQIVLKSSGKFDYLKGKSVRWQTLEPIDNVVTMTPKSIVSKQGDTEVLQMQADANPTVTLLNEIFFSILSARWQILELHFDLNGNIENDKWQVFLRPKDTLMSKIITKVELRGDKHLRHLTFFENNGDYTKISFLDLSLIN